MRFRREVLDELDAPFGHFVGGGADDLKFRDLLFRRFTLQIHYRQRAKPMIAEPAVLAFGVRRAEAAQVHARDSAASRRAGAAHSACPLVRGEELEVAVLQHHADVRGAGGAVLRLLRRCRRHGEAERLQRARGGAEVRHEVRDVIENQAARRRELRCGDAHAFTLLSSLVALI